MLLEGLEKTHADENAYRAQVRSACERTSCAIEGNLSDLLDADETHEPWIAEWSRMRSVPIIKR